MSSKAHVLARRIASQVINQLKENNHECSNLANLKHIKGSNVPSSEIIFCSILQFILLSAPSVSIINLGLNHPSQYPIPTFNCNFTLLSISDISPPSQSQSSILLSNLIFPFQPPTIENAIQIHHSVIHSPPCGHHSPRLSRCSLYNFLLQRSFKRSSCRQRSRKMQNQSSRKRATANNMVLVLRPGISNECV